MSPRTPQLLPSVVCCGPSYWMVAATKGLPRVPPPHTGAGAGAPVLPLKGAVPPLPGPCDGPALAGATASPAEGVGVTEGESPHEAAPIRLLDAPRSDANFRLSP